jgi:hypothetical protein
MGEIGKLLLKKLAPEMLNKSNFMPKNLNIKEESGAQA